MIKSSHFHNIFIGLIFVCLSGITAFAQTTAINYQGKLTDTGTPQRTYQMSFALYDALAGGSQIGEPFTNPSVAVNQGIFSVQLDFGAIIFTGADRFLQISVRRNAGETYTVLSPREKIASSSYSIRTLSAAQADIALDANKLGGINASEYVTSAASGNSFIKNSTSLQSTANFNISGNGFVSGNFGVIGESNPGDATGVFGVSTSPTGFGMYARNNFGGRAIFAEGNVAQDR